MKRIVCYVTDSQSLGLMEPRSDILAKIEAAVGAGVDWVQIREKEMPARQLLTIARAAVGMTNRKPAPPAGEDRPGSLILVNDRLDVALAGDAAGIHLGRESLPAQDVVALAAEREDGHGLDGGTLLPHDRRIAPGRGCGCRLRVFRPSF